MTEDVPELCPGGTEDTPDQDTLGATAHKALLMFLNRVLLTASVLPGKPLLSSALHPNHHLHLPCCSLLRLTLTVFKVLCCVPYGLDRSHQTHFTYCQNQV